MRNAYNALFSLQPMMERVPVGHSGVLDHVTEVVYLVKQIELTKKTSEALKALDDGNKDSLQVCRERKYKTKWKKEKQ